VRPIGIALALCVLLVAGVASANPIIGEQVYIDFDPPNLEYATYPTVGAVVDAYVMLDLEMSPAGGFTEVAFALAPTPGLGSGYTFSNLLPGATVEGDWVTGVRLIAPDCVTTFITPVARLSFVYEGTPGDVLIEVHPEYPRMFIDCADPGAIWIYCARYHGGVGKPAIYGDCGGSPVQDATWGAIKGHYR
jgi:hypothetical protein